MKIKYRIYLLSVIFILITQPTFTQEINSLEKEHKVILITFDGLRWQEVFHGADPNLIANPSYVSDTSALKKCFWRENVHDRRRLLLPFFWDIIASEGQLYGNRELGNKANLTNQMWFSYPGYNEILSGYADDERIHSNDKFYNPNVTVLEYIHDKPGFHGKVAAYTTWEVFPYIINDKRSGIPVNSGNEQMKNPVSERALLINQLQKQIPGISEGGRYDAFTFHLALSELKNHKPRLLFISFGQTDHFAHEGDYDQYLNSAHTTDAFIREIWNVVQSDPYYKDQTTLILTTDHGRGVDPEGWRHHGKSDVPHSDEVWMAFLGAGISPKGEVSENVQIYSNQIAATVAELLGYEYPVEKAGKSLLPMLK